MSLSTEDLIRLATLREIEERLLELEIRERLPHPLNTNPLSAAYHRGYVNGINRASELCAALAAPTGKETHATTWTAARSRVHEASTTQAELLVNKTHRDILDGLEERFLTIAENYYNGTSYDSAYADGLRQAAALCATLRGPIQDTINTHTEQGYEMDPLPRKPTLGVPNLKEFTDMDPLPRKPTLGVPNLKEFTDFVNDMLDPDADMLFDHDPF